MNALRNLLAENQPSQASRDQTRREFIHSSLAFLALGLKLDARQRTELQPMHLKGVEITRTYKNIQSKSPLGDYEIILLHKSKKLLPDRLYNHGSFQELLEGDPATKQDNGFILEESGNPWAAGGKEGSPSFNCHAYAVGERLGLTPNDWLEGQSSALTNNTNPLGTVLNRSFRIVREYSGENMVNDFTNDRPNSAGRFGSNSYLRRARR